MDESGVKTEYDIESGTGQRLRGKVLDGNDLLRETIFEYDHSKFKGFMTRRIVKEADGAGVATPDTPARLDPQQFDRVFYDGNQTVHTVRQ